jgi:hypothetical protein
MSSAPAQSAGGGGADSEKPKTRWGKLLSSTPVALTVIATILAGLSSSEMTQAQYHRSLAAQHQSKASDEWSFFQAKKLRGQNMELQAVMLRAASDAGTVDEKSFRLAATRLNDELAKAKKAVSQLKEVISRVKGNAAANLADKASALLMELEGLTAFSQDVLHSVHLILDLGVPSSVAHGEPEPVRDVFKLLNRDDKALPAVSDRKLTEGVPDQTEAERVEKAYSDIVARKPEEDTVRDMRHVSEEAIKIAYTNALYNSRNFEEECDRFRTRFEWLDKMVEKQFEIAGRFERNWRDFQDSLPNSIDQDTDWKEVRTEIAALDRSQRTASAAARQLYRDYKSVTDLYTARRYDKEANYNRVTATVAEIMVRKSGHESDRHRNRSKFFFYAMLLAQGGVTVSTLALAIKRGSLLWGMASLAGLLAISFAAYVYTQM